MKGGEFHDALSRDRVALQSPFREGLLLLGVRIYMERQWEGRRCRGLEYGEEVSLCP